MTIQDFSVTFDFDAASPADRDEISQLYRVGKILSHVATNGHVSIEAELPRRVLDRFRNRAARA